MKPGRTSLLEFQVLVLAPFVAYLTEREWMAQVGCLLVSCMQNLAYRTVSVALLWSGGCCGKMSLERSTCPAVVVHCLLFRTASQSHPAFSQVCKLLSATHTERTLLSW